MNAIIFASVLGLVVVFLSSQPAFAESIIPFVPFVTLADNNAGYVIKNDQAPITKVKSITIKLFESMTLDSGDKKSDKNMAKKDANKDAKKDVKKDTKKKVTKKVDSKKKVETKKKTLKEVKKSKTALKTKHDTAKNSIGNIR